MARRQAKPPSTSPNKVLVIFLVFFVLTNIGTAVWVYAAYKERDKWDNAAKEKDKKLKEAKDTADWNKFQLYELLSAIGDPKFSEKTDAVNTWRTNRKDFLESGAFKNEDGDVEFLATIKLLEKNLDGYDAKEGRYKTRFLEIREPLEKDLKKAQTQLATETKNYNATRQEFVALEKKYKDERDKLSKDIQQGSDKIIKVYQGQSESMTQAIVQNEKLRSDMKARDDEIAKTMGELNLVISNLKSKLKLQEDISKGTNRFTSAEPHALMLDISAGKPLWDTPRAKILRVEESGKRIFINKGAKDGVKPGLTFTVFASVNGRPVGEVKATLEVVRVEDDKTSLCKIGTFYDADGREIAASEASPARLYREGGGALKEGDLLFNLTWGMHVALVGIVDLSGSEAKNPAIQMDHLKDFMRHLERTGIIIDAYVDLRDGKLIGEINSKTNLIIRGATAVKTKEGDDDTRIKAVNTVSQSIRDQALERGLYIISPENFAIITGYRRPGSADAPQIFTFTPTRPGSAAPAKAETGK